MESSFYEFAKTSMTYKEISAAINKTYNIYLSPNAVRKRLRSAVVPSRRGLTSNTSAEVKTAIENLLTILPCTVGYKQMTDNLRQMGIHVRRYDKLKPYGFQFHGCIDGFSRKIMWLSVGPSNNDPAIIAKNYVECVQELTGCPEILQSDPGTENCVMGALQCLFRHTDDDCFSGINSYRVTRSVFNQRIKAWWCMMRRQQSEWWITLFRDMENFGAFRRGNENDLGCIRFCFMSVIQRELDLLVDRWNNHHISRNRTAVIPNGRPIVMHTIPEERGFKDCLRPVSTEDIDFALSQCNLSSKSGSFEFDERAVNVFLQKGWNVAYTWQESLKQYFEIVGMNIN